MASAAPVPIGSLVKLHGLSRADLNGRSGRVVSWSADKGRLGVQIDGSNGTLAVKPNNLHRKCDGCCRVVMDWEGPAELEVCPDCGYACCESCAVHSSRGQCRCKGSSFGRRPDGTPTRNDARCICSACKGEQTEREATLESERKRRNAGILKCNDTVSFCFRDASGAKYLRFGKTQRITCKCLATRRLEHAAWAGFHVAAVAPEQEVSLLVIWYHRAAPGVFTFDGMVVDPQDMAYPATAMLGIVDMAYAAETRRHMISEAQLADLQLRARALTPLSAASAPAGVSIEGEPVEASEACTARPQVPDDADALVEHFGTMDLDALVLLDLQEELIVLIVARCDLAAVAALRRTSKRLRPLADVTMADAAWRASVGADARLWAARKFAHKSVQLPQQLLDGDEDNRGNIASLHGGKLAVTFYLHRLLTVWDVAVTPVVPIHAFVHPGGVNAVSMAQGFVATACLMGPFGARTAVISVWDCGQGASDAAGGSRAPGVTPPHAVAPSPDSLVPTTKPLWAMPLPVAASKVCWVPHSTRLVVGLADGGLRLWDFSGGLASFSAQRDEPETDAPHEWDRPEPGPYDDEACEDWAVGRWEFFDVCDEVIATLSFTSLLQVWCAKTLSCLNRVELYCVSPRLSLTSIRGQATLVMVYRATPSKDVIATMRLPIANEEELEETYAAAMGSVEEVTASGDVLVYSVTPCFGPLYSVPIWRTSELKQMTTLLTNHRVKPGRTADDGPRAVIPIRGSLMKPNHLLMDKLNSGLIVAIMMDFSEETDNRDNTMHVWSASVADAAVVA